MRMEETDHWMTQVTGMLRNVSGKLNEIADLNVSSSRKLDQVGELNLALGRKLDRLTDRVDPLAGRVDQLAGTVDKFVVAQQDTNHRVDERFERLLTALEKRESS